jgi:hypothetical protein
MDEAREVGGPGGVLDEEFAASGDDEKDPAEQEALARDLGEELTDVFARFVRGEVDYADLTFLTFETLQDLYVIASGAYELEYEEDDFEEEPDTPAEQQEELAQEPSRP